MTLILIRRTIIFRQIATYYFQSKKHSHSLSILQLARDPLLNPKISDQSTSFRYNHSLSRSNLISKIGDQSNDYKIDIVDDEIWQVSTGFADVWKDATNLSPSHDLVVTHEPQNSDDPDFDEIDDLRICGNLFYKLDKDSKEYEEYHFDFHRKKSCKIKTKKSQIENVSKQERNPRNNDQMNKLGKSCKIKKKETQTENISEQEDKIMEIETKRNPRNNDQMNKLGKFLIGKKQRVPTFNQLTGPYHEPFCLDVYISKASVRACVVHRATSKVVAVAHSISKDMKFDLGSTKNAAACSAVGKVLAQRALADDIHNVVYTPRKGEKLEGKLQVVVASVMNNGVRVKIKLKKKAVNYKPN